ncbi:MAG: chemotaxis protein CheX [Ancrocorticia sp.]|jgi:CheY-specific phosphatase CheX|nr:chemotaxis protein CheX [Ancrocorticia sp.]
MMPRNAAGLNDAGLDMDDQTIVEGHVDLEEQVRTIVSEVFSSMIDGDAAGVHSWTKEIPDWEAPLCAWVDVHGNLGMRAAISLDNDTCSDLTRALLGIGVEENVDTADVLDALGELANVVGGNIKSMMADSSRLTLPSVATSIPEGSGRVRCEVPLEWRGKLVMVSLWDLDEEGNGGVSQ